MKKRELSNWRVEVEPTFDDYDHDDDWYRSETKALVKKIKRHCDVDSAQLCVDGRDVCSFCSAYWTEDSGIYNGGCCTDDEKANPESEPPSDEEGT